MKDDGDSLDCGNVSLEGADIPKKHKNICSEDAEILKKHVDVLLKHRGRTKKDQHVTLKAEPISKQRTDSSVEVV
ncbi:MAG TPA: hypothetical protein VKA60_14895 [Blastocatellia bacterium]|nr:hypothetical protein [Blastocatellia bacterium]